MSILEKYSKQKQADRFLVSTGDLVHGFNVHAFSDDHGIGESFIDPCIELLHEKIQQDPDAFNAFSYFKDQIVVDLGAGIYWRPYMLMCKAEARGYIGVDKFWAQRLAESLEFASRNLKKIDAGISVFELIPVSVAAEDMLSFLKRVPRASVSVFHSGLEDSVISDLKYRAAMAKEIERVLHPHGAYVSHQLAFPVSKLKLVIDDTDTTNVKVFRKDNTYGFA